MIIPDIIITIKNNINELHTAGTKGGATRPKTILAQFIVAKNGCAFISAAPLAPSLFAGSSTNN